MRAYGSLVVLLIASLAPATHAQPSNSDIVVRGDTAKAEIERILNADNLDTEMMDPRDVVDTIAAIPRGRAPEDFWEAYQRHVDAWELLADLTDRSEDADSDSDELASADWMINSTFDEVERVALSYGVRMPLPMSEVRRTA